MKLFAIAITVFSSFSPLFADPRWWDVCRPPKANLEQIVDQRVVYVEAPLRGKIGLKQASAGLVLKPGNFILVSGKFDETLPISVSTATQTTSASVHRFNRQLNVTVLVVPIRFAFYFDGLLPYDKKNFPAFVFTRSAKGLYGTTAIWQPAPPLATAPLVPLRERWLGNGRTETLDAFNVCADWHHGQQFFKFTVGDNKDFRLPQFAAITDQDGNLISVLNAIYHLHGSSFDYAIQYPPATLGEFLTEALQTKIAGPSHNPDNRGVAAAAAPWVGAFFGQTAHSVRLFGLRPDTGRSLGRKYGPCRSGLDRIPPAAERRLSSPLCVILGTGENETMTLIPPFFLDTVVALGVRVFSSQKGVSTTTFDQMTISSRRKTSTLKP